MRAALYDAAVAHDEDAVRAADGGQPVRDDKAGAALHHGGKRLLDADLGTGVNGACRLVEDEHGRTREHDARNTEKLFLALRDVSVALADAAGA